MKDKLKNRIFWWAMAVVLLVGLLVLPYLAWSSLNTPSNLLVDGDIEAADTSAWTSYNSAVLSKEDGTRTGGTGSKVLRVTYNGSNNPAAGQIILTSGYTYRITGWARGDGTNTPDLVVSSTQWTGTSSTDWQSFDVTVTSSTTGVRLRIPSGSAGYVEFDDIVIQRVGVIKTTSSVVNDWDMEASGTTAWTSYGNASISKETSDVWFGNRSLKATYVDTALFGVSQSGVLTGNTKYYVKGFYKTTGSITGFRISFSGGVLSSFNPSATWKEFSTVLTAPATPTLFFYVTGGAGGDYFLIDNVHISRLGGVKVKSNTLIDGDMEKAGTTDWINDGVTLTKESGTRTGGVGSQVLRVAYDSTPNALTRQSICTVGERYRIRGWARGDGTAYPRIQTGSTEVWTGTTSTDWQYYDEIFTANATGLRFYIMASGASYVEYDDVWVDQY